MVIVPGPRRPLRRATVAAVAAATVVGTSLTAGAAGPIRLGGHAVTSRVSVGQDGRQAAGSSGAPAVSAGGRYVSFVSSAANLVPGDTNHESDVFVRDRLAGVTRRVSVGPDRRQGNGSSTDPAVSADGHLVAFLSTSSNLVPGDTNGQADVFVRDRLAGTTRRVSVGPGGRQARLESFCPVISADGRYVAFQSFGTLVRGDTDGRDVFVRDRVAGVTREVSVGLGGRAANASSYCPAISATGRYVAFESFASNLVPGDTERDLEVFVRDRLAGVTQRVSVSTDGRLSDDDSLVPYNAVAISGDGRVVAFFSAATNLVAHDTNGVGDVFAHDRVTGTTRRVSVGPGGRQANRTTLADGPAVSADGRLVAFASAASNLVAGDTNRAADVFVRDRLARVTRRVSVGPGGRQGDRASGGPAISADGRHLAFESRATNLVRHDTNDTFDVFGRDRFGNVARQGTDPIERFAPYVGQSSCDPVVRRGAARLARLLVRRWGGGSLGIVRDCATGGVSEHKEGRAFDWALNYYDDADRHRAHRFLRWLLTSGSDGRTGEMVRRLGVQYVIWNDRIWASYRRAAGWRTYRGSSTHRDHMHISLSWAGALGRTSFWTGHVAPFDFGPCPVLGDDPAPIRRSFNGRPCPTPRPAPYDVDRPFVSLGSQGDLVRAVQRRLGVGVDGDFGPVTRGAVLDYQRAHDLPATGVVDERTWAELVPASTSPVLRPGGQGPWVRRLQDQLGMPAGLRNGRFDDRTEGYVRDFQATARVPLTGTSTAQTWNALEPVTDRTLRRGDHGQEVRLLQRRLGLEPSGHLDAPTVHRLVAFKRGHGLGERAVVDRPTRAWLRM